jgi:hypothetical protein
MTITYSEESLDRCQRDIEYLVPEAWAELGDSDIGDCKPNWAMYRALEERGALILLMARDENGHAVGYLFGVIHPHQHMVDRKSGTIATYFVRQCRARALLIRSLLSHACNLAIRRGACKVSVETEYNHSAGRILEAMGFKPKSIKYVMTEAIQERAHA